MNLTADQRVVPHQAYDADATPYQGDGQRGDDDQADYRPDVPAWLGGGFRSRSAIRPVIDSDVEGGRFGRPKFHTKSLYPSRVGMQAPAGNTAYDLDFTQLAVSPNTTVCLFNHV